MNFMFNCSFCGKEKDYVDFLVIGPAVSICDECVDIAIGIILRNKQITELEKMERRIFYEMWGTDL